MKRPSALIQRLPSPEQHRQRGTRLSGRWFVLARVGWVVIALVALAILIIGLPAYFTRLQAPCRSVAGCSLHGVLAPAGMQALQALGISLSTYAAVLGVLTAATSVVWTAVGWLIFWRKSEEGMALFVALLLVLEQLLVAVTPADAPLTSSWLSVLVSLLLLGPMVFAQLYRYRGVSTPPERQQTKWVVFGAGVALVGVLALVVAYLSVPAFQSPGSAYQFVGTPVYLVVTLSIPLSIGMAILRSRLWDIDLLIRRTLVYGTLTGTLALVYVGLVIGLQSLVRLLTGSLSEQPLILVASTLAMAALVQPLRRRLQTSIDRRFYRRKYDAQHTLAAFSATLRAEVDLDQVREQLLAVVQETMQSGHVSLWVRPLESARKDQTTWSSPPLFMEGNEQG